MNIKLIRTADYALLFHINTTSVLRLNIEHPLVRLVEKENDVSNKMSELIADKFNLTVTLNDDDRHNTADISFQSVILPIAGICNLKCPYCFAQTPQGFGFQNYTIEEGQKIIDYIMLNSSNEYPCLLSFFGGEPLLKFDVMKSMVEYVKDKYAERNVSYTITTNGTVFNNSIIQFIKQHNISCLISIDGPDNENNKRLFKNNKSSIHKVLYNIEKLRNTGIHMSLRATIPSNCNSMMEIYDFLEKLGINFAAVRAYQSVNKSDLADYKKSKAHFIGQYNELFNYYSIKIKNNEEIFCFSLLNDIYKINNKTRSALIKYAKKKLLIVKQMTIFDCLTNN